MSQSDMAQMDELKAKVDLLKARVGLLETAFGELQARVNGKDMTKDLYGEQPADHAAARAAREAFVRRPK